MKSLLMMAVGPVGHNLIVKAYSDQGQVGIRLLPLSSFQCHDMLQHLRKIFLHPYPTEETLLLVSDIQNSK